MKIRTLKAKPDTRDCTAAGVSFIADPIVRRATIQRSINGIHAHARKGLWGLVAFLGASAVAAACAGYGLSDCISAETREALFLGPAPLVILIDIIFAVSTASDLVLIAARISDGSRPRRVAFHLGFRVVFYLLYFIADSLAPRVFPVFLAGVVTLGLEQLALGLFASRTIREERRLLEAIAR